MKLNKEIEKVLIDLEKVYEKRIKELQSYPEIIKDWDNVSLDLALKMWAHELEVRLGKEYE